MRAWIEAFRLRTLPLALSSIFMGSILASKVGAFDGLVFGLACATTIFLQILSNLANDYGDSQHGADSADRTGPQRAVQSGAISKTAMMKAIVVFVVLSLVAGIWLILEAFQGVSPLFWIFLAIGIGAIAAAIKYTAGANPYGYKGLGDVFVFLFFGLVGVMGSYFLYTHSVSWSLVLPAMALGFLSTGVLNLNNVRDIESDKKAGKYSIPVRIGREAAVKYHWLLLKGAVVSMIAYAVLSDFYLLEYLFVLAFPLFVVNGKAVQKKKTAAALDPYLKQLALSTLLMVVLLGVGSWL